MTKSTSNTPDQSIDPSYHLPSAQAPTSPTWRILAVARWLQQKLSQVISRLRLLAITRGRSLRWRRLARQVIQVGAALLVAFTALPVPSLAASPQLGMARPRPPQNQPLLEDSTVAPTQPDLANPLSGVDVGLFSTPTFGDLDADGDLDATIGNVEGTIAYYKNTGTAINPAFIEQTGTLNPFNSVDVGNFITPSFADLDADGDLDAVIGENYGNLFYFKNTGSATNPAFIAQTGTLNPFNGVDVTFDSAPSFADLDADGDLDAVIGENDGNLFYYKNIGSATVPTFTQQAGTLNPFDSVDVGDYSTPSFADLDGDGDLDAFIGGKDGIINYFQNTGSAASPAFTQRTGTLNPFSTFDVGNYSSPTFADLDGDGDLDLFSGDFYGTIYYNENTRLASSPSFIYRSGSLNPLNGRNVGSMNTPSFADLDGDGDLDLFSGEWYGAIKYFENTGSATSPAFVQRSASLNPFNTVDVGYLCTPSFADLDGDGDLDAIIGETDGSFNYFQNTGSATAPSFFQLTGSLNPLDGTGVGYNSAPSFADLDGDGDLDLISGEKYGTIMYFQNTGSTTSPAFVQLTGSLNPFDGVDVGSNSIPRFADLDADGDLDAFSGEYNGTIQYLQNTGSATSPAFIQLSGNLNPLNGVNVGLKSAPSFADLDADGDLDAFIGEFYGSIKYFENTPLFWKLGLPMVLH